MEDCAPYKRIKFVTRLPGAVPHQIGLFLFCIELGKDLNLGICYESSSCVEKSCILNLVDFGWGRTKLIIVLCPKNWKKKLFIFYFGSGRSGVCCWVNWVKI